MASVTPEWKYCQVEQALKILCIKLTTKTKSVLPSLKPAVPKMLQSNVVYKIDCPGCDSSYVGQTVRHLQRRFREHIGNKGPMKSHFESCQINSPSNDIIKILDRSSSLPRLLTLEALYIKQHKPKLNTKDEYRSRTLTLKFWVMLCFHEHPVF